MEMTEQLRNSILAIIGQAIQDFRGLDEMFIPTADTIIFGEGSAVDSLTLVNIIVDIEDSVYDHLGVRASLTDDEAVFREPSPYASVGNLLDYVSELIQG